MKTDGNEMEENWLPVAHAQFSPYYRVSDRGRVRRIKRSLTGIRASLKKCLKPGRCSGGYMFVVLCDNKTRKTCAVHQLVANAFFPTTKTDVEINHIDSDRANNHGTNLAWVTKAENAQHGGAAKLSAKDVNKIRALNPQTARQRQIVGNCFGVSRTQIQNIIQRHSWKNI